MQDWNFTFKEHAHVCILDTVFEYLNVLLLLLLLLFSCYYVIGRHPVVSVMSHHTHMTHMLIRVHEVRVLKVHWPNEEIYLPSYLSYEYGLKLCLIYNLSILCISSATRNTEPIKIVNMCNILWVLTGVLIPLQGSVTLATISLGP